MASKSRKQLDEEIKLRFLEGVSEHLEGAGEQVLRVKSNEIALPVLDEEDNERWLVLTFKVPTGQRETGEEYDGYNAAEDYRMAQEAKKAKAEEKAKKAKADAEKRKAKAEEAEKIRQAKEAKKAREAEAKAN